MIKQLLTNDTTYSGEFIFSLPAFALMGNWNFGKYFMLTANSHCTHLQNTQAKPLQWPFLQKSARSQSPATFNKFAILNKDCTQKILAYNISTIKILPN